MKLNRWIEQKKFTNFLIAVLSAIIIVTGSYLFFLPQLQAFAKVLGINSIQKEKPVVIKSLSPTPTEEVLPSVTPTATPTVYIYKAPPPTINPDPPILCNVSANCGGGTTPLKQSECNNSTCCQIGDKWIFYKDKNKCTQDQGGQVKTTNPTQQNTQKTPGNNYYCWNNAYGYFYYTSSGDQCNSDNSKSTSYKICMDAQMTKNNSCKSTCQSQENQDSAACAWAYTGSNPGIESSTSKYGECLNGSGGASETYATCLGKCSDQYAQDIKQCLY